MKNVYCFFLLVLFSARTATAQTELTNMDILEGSISHHDPNQQWSTLNTKLRIQEPRDGNPGRYSVVHLNLKENEFTLDRNRDKHISTHIVNRNGESKVLFDGCAKIATPIAEKYRLDPEYNK